MWTRDDIVEACALMALAVVTALVVVASAHAEPSPAAQVAAKMRAHDAPQAATVGARIVSVSCRHVPSPPHVYYCAETWRNKDGQQACAEDAFHYLHGKVEPWARAWQCGQPSPVKIPAFPGDPILPGGPSS